MRPGDPLGAPGRSVAGPHTHTVCTGPQPCAGSPFLRTPPPHSPGGCSCTCPRQSRLPLALQLWTPGTLGRWHLLSEKVFIFPLTLRASRAIKGHARRQVHKCSIETDVMHTRGPGLAVNCQEHPPQRAGGPVHSLATELGGLGWGEALCSLQVKARWDPAQVSPEMPRQA